MAEARQAVGFQFAVTQEGIRVHFDRRAVKWAVKALASYSKSRYDRATSAVLNGLFPATPLSLFVIGGTVAGANYLGKDFSLGLNQVILNLLR